MLELAQNLEKRNVHIVSLDYNFDTRIATEKCSFILLKVLLNGNESY
ncbi:hypothetical protein QPL81_11475 [Bacillus toyonensis]|nr:hypothetical protein [Bacillus toyonensis]WIG30131.1 hypothetical protein QPL81_11475 [Bacillus toyonensis]